MPSDLTEAQATDLARYFLGPTWVARSREGDCDFAASVYWLRDSTQGPSVLVRPRPNWREAFRAEGVKLPVRPEFAAIGCLVMRNGLRICEAGSKAMADRIANALNWYTPGPRGT